MNTTEVKKEKKIAKVTITQSNIDNGTIRLASVIDIFPKSSIGASNAEGGLGKLISVYPVGTGNIFKTDISSEKIFRKRFMRLFYEKNNIKAGDTVYLYRIGGDKYVVHA